jgi:hypothetical protein
MALRIGSVIFCQTTQRQKVAPNPECSEGSPPDEEILRSRCASIGESSNGKARAWSKASVYSAQNWFCYFLSDNSTTKSTHPILSAAKDPLPKEILRSRCASVGGGSNLTTSTLIEVRTFYPLRIGFSIFLSSVFQ